jgi:antitoxin VapB
MAPAKLDRTSGEPVTRNVREAPREHRANTKPRKKEASAEELLAIADRASVHVRRPYVDHAELLYDEDGLPR